MIEAKTLPLGTVAASMCNKHRIVNMVMPMMMACPRRRRAPAAQLFEEVLIRL